MTRTKRRPRGAAGDGQVGFAEAQVTLARPPVVLPPNMPPTAMADRATTSRNTAVTIAILANDLDPDAAPDGEPPLRVVALTLPRHGLVRLDPDRTVTYTPDTDFTGRDSFAYVIEDARSGQSDGIVVLEVVPRGSPETSSDHRTASAHVGLLRSALAASVSSSATTLKAQRVAS